MKKFILLLSVLFFFTTAFTSVESNNISTHTHETECSHSHNHGTEGRCPSCNGHGKLICSRCFGSGGWYSNGWWVTCGGCNGHGVLICALCGGDGWW